MGYRDYATAKGHIVDTNGHGDFTTIASALTAASSGQTIFIMPGTYTENPTLKAGVNLTAYGSDSSLNQTGNVIISGKCTFTTAGSVTISGIQLQTNSDFLLAVTGSAASIVNLYDCYLSCTNNTGISLTSSNASASIIAKGCVGNLSTTGIAWFSHSSAGGLTFFDCDFYNTGASSTASTCSAGNLFIRRSYFPSPITTSGTATCSTAFTQWDSSAQNVTCFTSGGSGNHFLLHSQFFSGTASSVSISNTTYITLSNVNSSNANTLTGGGTLNYGFIVFTGSSSGHNVTTENALATLI